MTLDDARRILASGERDLPVLCSAVRELRGLSASDDDMWDMAERIYERQRMSASEVRRLRDAADAARDAYDDAREWCRHDDTEDARDVIGPLIRCSGCCRTVRYT